MNIKENSEYFEFLFNLQKTGATNMFGTANYLNRKFIELDKNAAKKILAFWMVNYELVAKELNIEV